MLMDNNMDNLIINNLKSLSIDMINNAKSGHPGIALGATKIIYTLYKYHMNVNYKDANWLSRDRFVLSAGHGSSLLYSMLYYAGFLVLEDLKGFRKVNSSTPGHPEITTNGVDISTGLLGEGLGSAVGMALAEAYLRSTNDNHVNYYTYVMCGDGDLEEGLSYEAMSLAGTLKLNKLIVLYDSNDISLDGKINVTFNENIELRMKSMNWNYIRANNDINDIDLAIKNAKVSDKPTLIEIKTIIGEGSLKEGTNKVHGSPLTLEDISNLKEKLNIPLTEFYTDNNLRNELTEYIYSRSLSKYNKTKEYEETVLNKMKIDIDLKSLINSYYEKIDEPLRDTSNKILNVISDNTYSFIGGSADLFSSTKTYTYNGGDFSSTNYTGKNIYYGVREHAMASLSNGIASIGLRPYTSTFLVFSDFMKPSIRLACLMKLPVLYIFTHDSITVGEDGATHEPIEQLSMLRSIPNLVVYRVSDANELLNSYNEILKRCEPSCLVVSKNTSKLLPVCGDVKNGAYIVKKETGRLNAIIIATGTEVNLALNVAYSLEEQGINLRVVSMPSVGLFLKSDILYQKEILPDGYKKIVLEYSNCLDFYRFTTSKYIININTFGCSGQCDHVLKKYNLDYESVKNHIIEILK